MTDSLSIEQLEPGIAAIQIDDPGSGNRLLPATTRALLDALAAVGADESLRVALLRGRPEVFCSGGSRETLMALVRDELPRDTLAQIPLALLACPIPVVAEMSGYALGGGMMMGLHCDLSVAAEGSRYGLNFADLGFTPGMGSTWLLPSLVGTPFAAEMMMTAKLYKGRELRGRGLFNRVLPRAEVAPAALDLARRIADKPRRVLSLIKESQAGPRRAAIQSAVAREYEMHRACFDAPETAQRISSNYLD